jgi:hypothetical protein
MQATPVSDSATYEEESELQERQVQKLLSRIEKELEPWKEGISQEMIERTYCTASLCTA